MYKKYLINRFLCAMRMYLYIAYMRPIYYNCMYIGLMVTQIRLYPFHVSIFSCMHVQ